MAFSNPYLAQLAAAYGIATEFWDWKGRLSEVEEDTIVSVLRAMDVDASTPDATLKSLVALDRRPWLSMLPRCVVAEQGRTARVDVHVTAGQPVSLGVRLEDGGYRATVQVDNEVPDRLIDGRLVGRATFELPADLPLGYHRLQAESPERTTESTLVVSPRFLGFPAAMGGKRCWGYATQLYSVRSRDSWGMGDLQDLADMATWSATQQFANFVLVNPLHAAEPMPPLEPSPYLPASRRYVNPLYIRPESIPEYAFLDEPQRGRITTLRNELNTLLAGQPQIMRNEIWQAKIAALRIVHSAGLRLARRMSMDDFARREGRSLQQFATWCVLVNQFGMSWRSWPVELQRPSSPEVADFAAAHADEIDFFAWLQWVADTQLSAAQSAAKDAGMRIGIMNDLAVGVSEQSAEAWTLGDVFATGVKVGAPPDHYNQMGQDWGQAPWRPDRLHDLSYAPFRSMVSGILRHSGGLRVDHVMGLFRLWWIPSDKPPSKGTYVRYNHEAMVGILALEAHRSGALVVGEDLGVVEPWVRTYLADRGILGTSVAWFEKDDANHPLPPEDWREYCLASVTTHDMPPTAGFLANDHIRLQNALGLLMEDMDDELARADAEREEWIRVLAERGLLEPGTTDVEEITLAMHRWLLATPSRVLCAALTDAVGERQTQNQPGTLNEYPNWRVPLSGPDGKPLLMEDLYVNERALRLSGVMNEFAAPSVKRRSAVDARESALVEPPATHAKPAKGMEPATTEAAEKPARVTT